MRRSSVVAIAFGVLALGFAGALLLFRTPVAERAAPAVHESPARKSLAVPLDAEQAPATRVTGRVRDSAGQPIASAEVRLAPLEEDGTSEHAVTQADGSFVLETTAPGARVFSVSAVGYLDILSQAHEVPREGMTLDFTLVPAVLLEGIVVDEAGKPLEAAAVAAMTPPRQLEDTSRPSAESLAVEQAGGTIHRLGTYESARFETETDGSGRFVLELPKGGPHFLVAVAEGFVITRVDVEAPAQGLRLVLRAGGKVEGTVVGNTGEPLWEVDLSLKADGTQTGAFSDTSNEQGRFDFRTVEPGRYTLTAAFSMGGPHRASQVVTVRPGESSMVTLRMDTGLTVSGIVVDEAGQPVSDVEVRAHSHRDTYAALEKQERSIRVNDSYVRTDASGRFSVSHLLPGKSVLSIDKQGYVLRGDAAEGGASSETSTEAVVTAGAKDVRLVLRYQGSLRGRLRRPDGTPITRFIVNDTPFQDEAGAFRLLVEAPGVMWLTLDVPGLTRTVREVQVEPGQDVDLGDLVLEAGRRVRGRVVDATTSAPVAGARVSVRLTRPARVAGSEGGGVPELASIQTDPSGTFEFESVESGPLSLDVAHSGYLPLQQQLGSGDAPLELRLSSGARLEGTVKDRDGRPANVVLRVIPMDEQKRPSAGLRHVKDGAFEVGGLEPGEYVLKVVTQYDFLGNPWSETRSGRYVPRRVTLAPDERRVLQLQEQEGRATLRLRRPRFTGIPPENIALDLAVLIPGAVPQVRTYGRVEGLGRDLGVPSPTPLTSPEVVYDALPAGRYTYLLVGRNPQGGPYVVHSEALVVPEEGVLVRDIQPVWVPITRIIL
ncbi:carboxypeptidase-like regulatory domain-containing protein [Myxococcus qinghaiensis]|uniref:carboxypeptidase-like regulatory domain-containing protein n=1 Tax=Myxococcus qinghaiensis TaxID=2906758 RepID=UPI0020A75708|nr:carboxypeptidase-like regulatory domain-containing protein [Myxococcus qinghaiensis]MCP3168500.1 carboxypeptidase-like regulatory domain-containing protein [Myxococcus qinghaiensis]